MGKGGQVQLKRDGEKFKPFLSQAVYSLPLSSVPAVRKVGVPGHLHAPVWMMVKSSRRQ